ncbi:hypothetical protein V8C34DRAFT_91900 [Trichoderma compactum]
MPQVDALAFRLISLSLSLVYSATLPILLPMSPSNLVTYLSTARQSLIRLSRNRFARLMCIHSTRRELSTSRILPPTEDAQQRAKRHATNDIKQGRGKALAPETKPPLTLDLIFFSPSSPGLCRALPSR